MRLPRCYGELGRPCASRTVSSYFPYLSTTKMTSKLTCVLRYVTLLRLRLHHILRSASAPLLLISFPVLLATFLQQDVCQRLILGYNRWYFISAHLTPPTLFAMSYPFTN